MNVLVIILISAVCLVGAYVLYGRWLANKWLSLIHISEPTRH